MAGIKKAERTGIKKPNRTEISSEHELFVIQQLAQLKSPKVVAELCDKRFPDDKKISIAMVRYYKHTREPIIEELRDKFISKAMNIPIANERVRLKRTEDLYNASSNLVARDDDRLVLSAVEVSLKCLKEAREEVKGEGSSTQNILQFNQYNELTDEQLMDKKKELEDKFLELSKKGEVYAKVEGT